MPDAKTSLLRQLKRERLHVEPGALEASPARVCARLPHAFAPVDLLLDKLAAWPAGLLAYWLAAPAGHVVLTAGSTGYVPVAMPWPGGGLQAVARVSLTDLLDQPRVALEALAHLLDHLLGALGAPDAPWLSEGAGSTPALRDVGRRLQTLAALGYGPQTPRAYFAWALAGYWLDRRALNAADPNVERLLRSTLCSDEFWGRDLCLPSGN